MTGALILLLVAGVFAALIWVIIRSTRGPATAKNATSAGVNFDSVNHGSAGNSGVVSSASTNVNAASARTNLQQETHMSYQEVEGRALQAYNSGDYKKAIELYDEALGIVHETLGGDSTELARLLIAQGDCYMATEGKDPIHIDPSEIDAGEYRRALSIYDQRVGPDGEELLNAISKLMALYDRYGAANLSSILSKRADRIRARRASPDFFTGSLPVSPFDVTFDSTDRQANNLVAEGDSLFRQGEYQEGAAKIEEACEIIYDKEGENSDSLALLLHRLGRLYQIKDAEYRDNNGKHFTDPADMWGRALAIVTALHGGSDRKLIPLLLDLASFEDQRGDHAKADLYLDRIQAIKAGGK